jgi:hypothetical protein
MGVDQHFPDGRGFRLDRFPDGRGFRQFPRWARIQAISPMGRIQAIPRWEDSGDSPMIGFSDSPIGGFPMGRQAFPRGRGFPMGVDSGDSS